MGLGLKVAGVGDQGFRFRVWDLGFKVASATAGPQWVFAGFRV